MYEVNRALDSRWYESHISRFPWMVCRILIGSARRMVETLVEGWRGVAGTVSTIYDLLPDYVTLSMLKTSHLGS